jgi:pyruvate formate lyase activating enzyme
VNDFPSCHIEITTLVIPGLNSSRDEIDSLSEWLASLSSEIPLHLSRHHPDYQLLSPEPIDRNELLELAEVARFHLRTVLCGNM